MRKIVHLSDAHVGHADLTVKLDDVVTGIISKQTSPEDYVVVISGDIVENATQEGSYEEASASLARLEEAGFRLLVIPGNHDYGTGSLGNGKYVEEFKKQFFGGTNMTYPKLDIIDGIAFIGLDSMAEELNWYDRLFAEGELGREQLGRLEEMLRSTSVKESEYTVVYLHHHPFHPWPFHQLKDSGGLEETLEAGKVDALLFGHNHEGLVLNGGWGIARVYDAGTSTGKERVPGPHRVIDLSQDPSLDYDGRFATGEKT